MLFFRSKIVNLLIKLLVLLKIILELIDGFFGDLIKLVFFLLYWGCLFDGYGRFLLSWGCYVLLLYLHLLLVDFFAQ